MKEDLNKSESTESAEAALKAFRDEFADLSEMMQVIGAKEPAMGDKAIYASPSVEEKEKELPGSRRRSWWRAWAQPHQWGALAATLIIGISSGVLWMENASSRGLAGDLQYIQVQGLDARGDQNVEVEELLSALPDDIDVVQMEAVDWQTLTREGLPDGTRATVLLDPFSSQFVFLVRSQTNPQRTILWRSDFDGGKPLWPQLSERMTQLGLVR